MIISVLKIIGIIILVILILLILILGILLFTPIRYEFAGEYREKPRADVLFRWSPVLLKVILQYHNDEFIYVIRLLGGVIMTNQDIPLSWIGKKLASASKDKTSDVPASDETGSSPQEKSTFVVLEDELVFDSPKDDKTKDFKRSAGSDIAQQERTDKKTYQEKDKRKKQRKKKSVWKTIREKIDTVSNKIKQFIAKLKKLNEKKEALLRVYHSKRFEVAKKDVISYVKILWGIIRPKTLSGYVHFGLENPASTGQALGIMAVFFVWYDEFLRIEPDFQQACIDGYLNGKGRIRLFPIVKLCIKILFNKNLIKVIKKVQTIIEA